MRHPLFKDAISISIFVVLVVIGTILINSFVFRSFSVIGPSMENTLFTNDRLIVNRLPVTWSQLQNKPYLPERGQVIVFKNPRFVPGTAEEYIVKRVVAFGGERVVLQAGKYTVYNDENKNGFNPDEGVQNVEENAVGSPTSGSVDMLVPENELFVSGDHRQGSFSLDSRNGLGTVPLYDIVGPVSLRVFPFDKISGF